MMAFGATKCYSAACPEAHHKEHAKQPGRPSQKRIRRINQQYATHVADAFVVQSTMQLFSNNTPANVALTGQQLPGSLNKDDEDTTTHDTAAASSSYMLTTYIDVATDELCYYVQLANWAATPIVLEPNLEYFLMDYYRTRCWDANTGISSPMLCTEYRRHDSNGETLIQIRCHPDYRSNGPWYDWAFIRFEDNAGNCTDYPSRILPCVPSQEHDKVPDKNVTFELVVQCCSAPLMYRVSCSAIVSSVVISMLWMHQP
jgi:hypothetical protein